MMATKTPISVRTFAIRWGYDPHECTPTGETFCDWLRRWLRSNRGPEVGVTYVKKANGPAPEPLFRQPDLLRAANAWNKRGDTGAQLQLGFA